MIHLIVQAVTGHYTQPGAMFTMGVARTYPIAPPSTMVGFLESLCGLPVGAFRASGSKLAYGWANGGRPKGFATLLQRMHVMANPTDNQMKALKCREGQRPFHRECHFDMAYRVSVSGSFENLIRKSLVGEAKRAGVVSLGDSDDMIDWIEESSASAEWLVPGTSLFLPIMSPRNTANVQAVRGTFDFTSLTVDVPDKAWMTAGGNA